MSVIRSLTKPTLLLEDLQILEDSEITYNNDLQPGLVDVPNAGMDNKVKIGLHGFYLNINGMQIPDISILFCRIETSDKYPTITGIIHPNFDEFMNFGLPKDGDIVSVYYRSTIDDLKPLRLDFIITDISSDSIEEFTFFGVINLPELFKDSSYYFKGTSFELMRDIASNLKLGFSTNDIGTNDSQTWVCASDPIDVFLEKVTSHSWKNEKSFFYSYIDIYYNLNYINVFDQLSNEKIKKIYPSMYTLRELIQYNKFSNLQADNELNLYSIPLVLNNWTFNVIKEISIKTLKVLNGSSRISLEEGYQKYIHFYDYILDEKFEFNNESLTSAGREKDYYYLKGKYNDANWRKNTRHIWAGILYGLPSHNHHPFYFKAKYHNEQNLKEIDKLTIEITLESINFNIHRFQVIPIVWYEYGDMARKLKGTGGAFDTSNPNFVPGVNIEVNVNEFISGYYVVKEIYFEYSGKAPGNPPEIRQRIVLTRTEWPKAVVVTDDQNKVVKNIK